MSECSDSIISLLVTWKQSPCNASMISISSVKIVFFLLKMCNFPVMRFVLRSSFSCKNPKNSHKILSNRWGPYENEFFFLTNITWAVSTMNFCIWAISYGPYDMTDMIWVKWNPYWPTFNDLTTLLPDGSIKNVQKGIFLNIFGFSHVSSCCILN